MNFVLNNTTNAIDTTVIKDTITVSITPIDSQLIRVETGLYNTGSYKDPFCHASYNWRLNQYYNRIFNMAFSSAATLTVIKCESILLFSKPHTCHEALS